MSPATRRVAVAGALLAVAAASSGVASAQTVAAFPKANFAEQKVQIERVTAGVHMTKAETSPSRGFTGPTSMAVSPDDPRVIVAATADLRNRLCYLLVSTDAGGTWSFSDERPAPEAYPYCTNTTAGVPQASLAWGSNGTLYYAMQAYGEDEGPRPGKTSIALARTKDLGRTWTTTLVDDARAAPDPKPENTGVPGLAVDTSGSADVIHVGFSRDWSATAPEGHPLEKKREVSVSTSTDGGKTFAPPVDLNEQSKLTMTVKGQSYPIHFQTAFGRPYVVAHDGVVMAVGDGGPPADNGPPSADYGGIFGETTPMVLARSTDKGKTWTVTELSKPLYNAAGSYTGMGWTKDGGPDGTFVFAYSATPGGAPNAGRSDIVIQRSTDKGLTWSDPVAINDDDPKNRFTSFYPELDVAPNGRVDVIWQDNRDLTDYLVNVRYSYSTDGGKTWAHSTVVNDQPINFKLGISFNSDIRQPPGVASTNSYASIAWADSRFAEEKSQTQDNFGVVAQFSPLPSDDDNGAWPVIAAILGGLGVAGIVLLGIQAVRRKA
ncbi:MAG: sialidase family protein [Acidimicrobiales bacterium]